MQPESTAADKLSAYFESGAYGHAAVISDLIVERDHEETFLYLEADDDEPRFTITDAGRRTLRMTD